MKLNDVLDRLCKDGTLEVFVVNGKCELNIRITPEVLTANLNDIAIDFHNLVENKSKINPYIPKWENIVLNTKQQKKLMNYLNK